MYTALSIGAFSTGVSGACISMMAHPDAKTGNLRAAVIFLFFLIIGIYFLYKNFAKEAKKWKKFCHKMRKLQLSFCTYWQQYVQLVPSSLAVMAMSSWQLLQLLLPWPFSTFPVAWKKVPTRYQSIQPGSYKGDRCGILKIHTCTWKSSHQTCLVYR